MTRQTTTILMTGALIACRQRFPVFAIDANHEHAGCRPHGPAQPAESSDDEDAPAIAGITEDDTSFVQDGLRSAFPMSFGRSIMTFGRATRRLPV